MKQEELYIKLNLKSFSIAVVVLLTCTQLNGSIKDVSCVSTFLECLDSEREQDPIKLIKIFGKEYEECAGKYPVLTYIPK